MSKHNFSAAVAVLLAVLFPLYWGLSFTETTDFLEQHKHDMTTLDLSDLFFVGIGVLEVYIYLSLRRCLAASEHLTLAHSAALMMAVTAGIFHSTVLMDMFFVFSAEQFSADTKELLMANAAFISMSILFIYVVFSLTLSLSILWNRKEAPKILNLYAIVLFTVALMQLTVVWAVLNTVLLPIAFLLLAVYFRKHSPIA